jgi:hypothetical protein
MLHATLERTIRKFWQTDDSLEVVIMPRNDHKGYHTWSNVIVAVLHLYHHKRMHVTQNCTITKECMAPRIVPSQKNAWHPELYHHKEYMALHLYHHKRIHGTPFVPSQKNTWHPELPSQKSQTLTPQPDTAAQPPGINGDGG